MKSFKFYFCIIFLLIAYFQLIFAKNVEFVEHAIKISFLSAATRQNWLKLAQKVHKDEVEHKTHIANWAKSLMEQIESDFINRIELTIENSWKLPSALVSAVSIENEATKIIKAIKESAKPMPALLAIIGEVEAEMKQPQFINAVKELMHSDLSDIFLSHANIFNSAKKVLTLGLASNPEIFSLSDEQLKLFFFYFKLYKKLLNLLQPKETGNKGKSEEGGTSLEAFLLDWLEKMVEKFENEIVSITIQNNSPWYQDEQEEKEVWKTLLAQSIQIVTLTRNMQNLIGLQ